MPKYITKSVEETKILAKKLAERMQGGEIVFIYGNLGAGKTHFSQGFLEAKGVKDRVKSPTYTLVKEYRVEQNTYVHFDVYRLSQDCYFDFMAIEEAFEDSGVTCLVEWPEKIPKIMHPKKRIDVYLDVRGENIREVTITFFGENLPDMNNVEMLWKKYITPKNIIHHMKEVANVAGTITDILINNGEVINKNLVLKAALLHDLVRLIHLDIESLDPKIFDSKLTAQNIKTWKHFQNMYSGMSHEEAGGEILLNEGYGKDIAHVVKKHKIETVLEESPFRTWEEKIVFYADKRVLHDTFVTLQERFDDSLQRHFHGKSSPKREKIIEKCFALEKEIFKAMNQKI